MPRMRILTKQEQKDFDLPPVFNHADRKQVFSFPKSLLQAALALRTSSNQIGFLLNFVTYFLSDRRHVVTMANRSVICFFANFISSSFPVVASLSVDGGSFAAS